jgi:hypothetical protein
MEGIFLNPQSEIPGNIKILVNALKGKVLKFNKSHLNNQKMFNFIQPLANL